jgi:monoamine oxidase
MKTVIVVGAGAAGLMAARLLSEKGIGVVVLEVRNNPGGRIFTLSTNEFSRPIDLGAEFVHGDPPIIKSIVKEAGLKLHKSDGRRWHLTGNKLSEEDPFAQDWGEFMHLLNRLETDMPIGEFLRTRFKGEAHESLREAVIRFVQGFDAADAEKASAFSLREEWAEPDDALIGYHIEGGYIGLISFLHQRCIRNGVRFHFASQVKHIHWNEESVRVVSASEEFQATACIMTVPPAVLRTGRITFTPELNEQMNAIEKIETGGVIKFLFEFDKAIWDSSPSNGIRQFPDMHFIFSDAIVPTWWSQRPSPQPLLTGWLSGPVTKGITKPEKELMENGLHSLAYLLGTNSELIASHIRAWRVVNWDADPWSLGAYAYRTVGIQSTLEFLSRGVGHVIYFAGEAFHGGKEIGTVEAALQSGKHAAERILNTLTK